MVKLIHTSDWHLGHVLHDVSRRYEQERFLDWLHELIGTTEADVLLVCGDVFDSANPSAEAQTLWYRFLARAAASFPEFQVVVVGGNHDSAARLNAPAPLLDSLHVTVVGGVPKDGRIPDYDSLCVPLSKNGEVSAWVAAVPYLRAADLPRVDGDDPLIDGVREFYAQALARLRQRASPGQPLLAMGHCYMTGSRISGLSERKVLGGNQHALPGSIFPDDLSYAALGHLHLAQHVGSGPVHYSGSPIPLSLAEKDYVHQVAIVELEPGSPAVVTHERVPRTVAIARVPESGFEPLPEVLVRLAAFEPPPSVSDDAPVPLLEVGVLLDSPQPTLRADIEGALEGKPVRLARIVTEYSGHGKALGDAAQAKGLKGMEVEEIFKLRWAREYETVPGKEILTAFHELLEQALQGAGE